MYVVAIIPARGGSKGIPRKNLRPLAGNPLIYYSIKACLSSKQINQVVVTTDDEEIAMFAERFGATVVMRPTDLADDMTTLDPVIKHAYTVIQDRLKDNISHVVTVQPTSPLVSHSDIDSAIELFADQTIDTVLSVVDDRHLNWTLISGIAKPLYTRRVNRQQLPINFRETGAVIACTSNQLLNGSSRIGSNVALLEMPQDRSFDIDNFSDLALCESILNRRKIVFAVIGYNEVGLGHVYRTLMLANELVAYDLHFVCEKNNDLAIENIKKQNYRLHVCDIGSLVGTIVDLEPDLVINDILDTSVDYIHGLKLSGCKVLNFEDIGPGYLESDLVINALYPHQLPSDHVLVGPQYFWLRDEFSYLPERAVIDSVKRLLLTFGGVDEGNVTSRVLRIIGPYCADHNIIIDVVAGPGFLHKDNLFNVAKSLPLTQINIELGTKRISDIMNNTDLAITSGGRTVLELSALAVPTVVICQNVRETTHTFASSENGIVNLGFRDDISDETILLQCIQVIESRELRNIMIEKMRSQDFSQGKRRVLKRIFNLLGN
jgi:CMP-N-acetylneuraminic acid synthetase/spore coat polysaccharide biosynthesis predicted glycosyltransferase SpsG